MSSPRGSRTPRRDEPETPRRSGRGATTPARDVPETPPARGTPRRGRNSQATPAKSTTSNNDEISTPMRQGPPMSVNGGSDVPPTSPAPSMVPTSPAAGKAILTCKLKFTISHYSI